MKKTFLAFCLIASSVLFAAENSNCCNSEYPSHKAELANLGQISDKIETAKKMIADQKYCCDILSQLRAARIALKNLELRILDTHLSSCVHGASISQNKEQAKIKIDEIREIVKNLE